MSIYIYIYEFMHTHNQVFAEYTVEVPADGEIQEQVTGVLQCNVLYCIVLLCDALCCSVVHCDAVCCSVLQCVAVRCSAGSCRRGDIRASY